MSGAVPNAVRYTYAWHGFPGERESGVPVSEEGQIASMWLMTSVCPSLFLETHTGAWDRPRLDKYNFCSKTLEITRQGNTLYWACEMLLDWSQQANPGHPLHGGLTYQWTDSTSECVTFGRMPCLHPLGSWAWLGLTVFWKSHKLWWLAGKTDSPGVTGTDSELIRTPRTEVFDDEVSVQGRSYRLLPGLGT